MLRLVKAGLAALLVVAFAGIGRAAYDVEAAALPALNLELLVVEAEGCIYCQIFRRDVLPAYQASPRAGSVPIGFLDVNEVEPAKLALEAPIDEVPTVLLLKDRQEVGRITGYVGPESFFHAVNRLIARIE
ncbi:MAG TPA: thioredoxin fold domain-containing protein [Hyphomicrobiaceae bacterium]|nr:thioredoxin fold domain-containing protein [Hyphomicrobiaceae bacterium]